MENLFFRRTNKYNKTETTNFSLYNFFSTHKKNTRTFSNDNKTIKNFNYYLFKYNEMNRKVPLRQYLLSNENNLIIKNFKKPHSLNPKNNTLHNKNSKKNIKYIKIIINSKDTKKKFVLIPPLKKAKIFSKKENICSISEKLISKKIHRKLPSSDLYKKNNHFLDYDTENDMKPKVMFKNIKKELDEETLKINKMFTDFNREISDKELSIRAILTKLNHRRSKKNDDYCDLLHL